MNKDEMKNRISLALKDPILQQGFEIICKNLKELEKENQDLRDNYDQFKAIAEPEIERFQKENAELRARLNAINLLTPELQKRSKLKKQQLTKAKDLLKMALDWQGRCGNGHPTWQEVCVKIEQFLKDSEVKNDSTVGYF